MNSSETSPQEPSGLRVELGAKPKSFRWAIWLISVFVFVAVVTGATIVGWSPNLLLVQPPSRLPTYRKVNDSTVTPHSSKVGSVLTRLADNYARNGGAALRDFESQYTVAIDSKDRIQVYLIGEPNGHLEIDHDVLSTFDVEVVKSSGEVIQAFVPVNQLDRLAEA